MDAPLSSEPIVCPNPAPFDGHPLYGRKVLLRYPALEILGVSAVFYNQAGEKVGLSLDSSASGDLWFDYENRASGVYLVALQGRLRSGAAYRNVMKLAIVR